MMNKYNDNLNITNDNYLNLAVYEKETFKKIFPQSTDDDYYKNEFVADYPFKIITGIESEYNIELSGSRFVYIDNNFIDFCNENNLDLKIQSLHKYLKILSDEECSFLWNKSNRNFDLVLCSIPLIIQSLYKSKNNNIIFSKETLENTKKHLANALKVNESNIYIYENPLSKDEALINKDNFESYFKDLINSNFSKINFVKSIFKEFSTDSFCIKYLICGIRIDRNFKMSKHIAELDSMMSIGSLLVNDEMAILSEILSQNNLKAKIYPAFDRIISLKEIESSEEVLKKFLPQLIIN